MTDVPAQVDVEAEILRLSNLAEKVTTLLAKRATESAEKDAAYRNAHARAVLKSSGTVAEREAQAAIDTEVEYLDRKLAEAKLDAAKEAGRNYRAQLDALRSINANLRGAITHAEGYGG